MKMKTRKFNYLGQISQMFAGNPVMYFYELSVIGGSVNAGLLLSYLLYWQGKGSKGQWTYKTVENLRKDIGLSKANQSTAIKALIKKELLEVRLKGIPAKRHFKIDIQKLTSYTDSLIKSGKIDRRKESITEAGIKPSITENTQRFTSEKYTENRYENLNAEGRRKYEEMKEKIFNKINPNTV